MNAHDLNSRTMQTTPGGAGTGLNFSSLNHPEQVLGDQALTLEQKREVLASWASDQHAVPDKPNLRRLESGSVLEVQEILDALRFLDAVDGSLGRMQRTFERRSGKLRQPRRSASPGWRPRTSRWDDRDDGDDDPPPFPVCAVPPNRRPPPDPASAALRIPAEHAEDVLEERMAQCLLPAA